MENNVENLKNLIAICDLKPKRNSLLITLNQTKPQGSNLELEGEDDNMLDEYQYVVAAGEGAQYKVGDKVLLDISNMTKRVPDPNDRMSYVDMIDIKPVIQGDYTLTIISDNYVLASVIEREVIDLKA